MKLKELNEEAKTKARWVREPGPNNIGGFDLQIDTVGGWESLGFVKSDDKPASNTGMIKIFRHNEMADVDLDSMTFEK